RGLAAMRPVVPAHAFGSEEAEEQRSGGAGENPSPAASLPRCASAPLLVRPLLCITREEVESYCCERGLEFRSDETNLSLHYTRNRIRNEVLPALKKINRRVVHSIARAAEHLADDQDVLDHLASLPVESPRVEHGANGVSVAYSVSQLRAEPAGLRRRIIIEALKRMSPIGEITSSHVAAVEALTTSKLSGKRVELFGSLEVWREFDSLVFKSTAP